MALGRHLRELWSHRAGLVVSVMLGLLAALWSVGSLSLFPPTFKPRSLEMAAANARVLVDAPRSSVLDLSVSTYDFRSMTNRSLLVGNVMASEPVRRYIGRRAGLPAELLQVSSPITPDFPRALASSGKRQSSDILDSPDQYRLSIQANPTAPIVDVYAQAPTAEAAQQLANGAVDGMKDYLRDIGTAETVPLSRRIQLEQLGRAKGAVINPGVSYQVALLSFLFAFAASAVAVLCLVRLRRGWAMGGGRDASEPPVPVAPRAG